jgi:hypothetical protein
MSSNITSLRDDIGQSNGKLCVDRLESLAITVVQGVKVRVLLCCRL